MKRAAQMVGMVFFALAVSGAAWAQDCVDCARSATQEASPVLDVCKNSDFEGETAHTIALIKLEKKENRSGLQDLIDNYLSIVDRAAECRRQSQPKLDASNFCRENSFNIEEPLAGGNAWIKELKVELMPADKGGHLCKLFRPLGDFYSIRSAKQAKERGRVTLEGVKSKQGKMFLKLGNGSIKCKINGWEADRSINFQPEGLLFLDGVDGLSNHNNWARKISISGAKDVTLEPQSSSEIRIKWSPDKWVDINEDGKFIASSFLPLEMFDSAKCRFERVSTDKKGKPVFAPVLSINPGVSGAMVEKEFVRQ